MTPIEILAIIFAVLILVKLLFVLIKPGAWMSFVGFLYKNSVVITIVYIMLAALVGYYLFVSNGMNIVQVAAAGVFISLLMGIGFAPFSQKLIAMQNGIMQERGKAWLAMLIWAAIAIWTLWVVFV